MSEENEDLPLIMAEIIAAAPALLLRTGAAYLRHKGRSRTAAKTLASALVANGMPPVYAQQLAEGFASDLSIRRLLASARGPRRVS